jgi:chorismate--pyruvate lyase
MIKFAREPIWRLRRQLTAAEVPANVADWLFDSGSLTSRIIAACPGRFHVQVVSQGWQVPMRNEVSRLGMRRGRLALVRQVYLFCDDTPWVFARTVIPRATLRGKQKYLARLGNKPLGAALFADPSMQRAELEVTRLSRAQSLLSAIDTNPFDSTTCIWGRRSVFYVGHKPLLVAEFFLPPLAA